MSRIEALRNRFNELNIDGMVIASAKNRQYLSNFTGTAGVLVISKNEAKFITDFRYTDQANEQVKDADVLEHTGPILEEIAKVVTDLNIKRLGFEQDHVTFGEYKTYTNAINAADLVPISGLVESLRMIKSNDEIKIIKEAAEIADAAFSHILTFISAGKSEKEVSLELEFFMRKNGAISSSFDIIVASGVRSALPHGVASDKIIEQGDFVTLDFGAFYKGYCSDITRTIAVGTPAPELKEIYEVVKVAQDKGMQGIKAGMTGKQADALTRDYISQKGYGKYFGHSTGHGLGMDVHEGPALSIRSDTILKPGMIVTVEPGIYISGLGGVRIEDDVVITADGNISLTKSSKELIML